MRIFSRTVSVLVIAIAVAGATPAFAGEKVRFSSPTEAYRHGEGAYHAELYDLAVPALEYAAIHGILGAQLRLAKMYAAATGVPQSDAKAFHYYQLIADEHAETSPRHPIVPYVAEAFVAIAGFYRTGIAELKVKPDMARAVGLLRHAASYFGDPAAQFMLAKMYLEGEGVPRNARLAVNWLTNAAKKQHAPSQAVLGNLLWRGEEPIRRQPLKGLALLSLARQNAAGADEASWIKALHEDALAEAGAEQRASATRIASRWRRQLPNAAEQTAALPAVADPAGRTKTASGQGADGLSGIRSQADTRPR